MGWQFYNSTIKLAYYVFEVHSFPQGNYFLAILEPETPGLQVLETVNLVIFWSPDSPEFLRWEILLARISYSEGY